MSEETANNPWDYDHEDYSRADWRAEVQNDETLLGYREWVNSRLEADEREDEIDYPTIIVEVKDNAVRAVYDIPSGVVVRVEDHDCDAEDAEIDESILIPGKQVLVRTHLSSPAGTPSFEA